MIVDIVIFIIKVVLELQVGLGPDLWSICRTVCIKIGHAALSTASGLSSSGMKFVF